MRAARTSDVTSEPRTMPTPAYREMHDGLSVAYTDSDGGRYAGTRWPGPTSPLPRGITVACWPAAGACSRAERIATANSAPSPPIQPKGPAYRPRSKSSEAASSARASARGRPQTAGVGCRAAWQSSRTL